MKVPPPLGVSTEPVSILKPLAGLDEGLEANLRTFFTQDYASFEILFAVRTPADPAVKIVEKLQLEFSHVPSKLIFTGEPPWANAKVYSLDKMMAAIGLDRSRVYIINVMPWRPPDNRNPDVGEVAMCIPFLRRHIELARPKVLVMLGAVSARHVLGLNDGIMKLRGRWLEYRIGTEMIPVLPTLHPAYLLRQPAHKKLAWRDLQALAEKLETLGLPVGGND